jgi:hypothetical protein
MMKALGKDDAGMVTDIGGLLQTAIVGVKLDVVAVLTVSLSTRTAAFSIRKPRLLLLMGHGEVPLVLA